jgi:hypothetical protein
MEICPTLEYPHECKISVTFDGNYFTEYHESFLIYSPIMKLGGLDPKYGPTVGVTKLSVNVNLDNIPSKYLFSLSVGFQARVLYN